MAEVKRELSLRSRALSCGALFPEPKVMKEFLNNTPECIDFTSLRKPTPSLIQFVVRQLKTLISRLVLGVDSAIIIEIVCWHKGSDELATFYNETTIVRERERV